MQNITDALQDAQNKLLASEADIEEYERAFFEFKKEHAEVIKTYRTSARAYRQKKQFHAYIRAKYLELRRESEEKAKQQNSKK